MLDTFKKKDSPEVATETERFSDLLHVEKACANIKCKSFFNCLENAQ